MQRRQEVRQFFRQLDKTEEWVENNYYHLPIERQVADLISVNAFWRDFALFDGQGPFLSTNISYAHRNFAEMMLALAVLDLPFRPAEHSTTYSKTRMELRPASPLIVFHREIQQTERLGKEQVLLTSQNFFAHDDRYRYENNERFDRFVTEEFQTHRVYGCQVVLTNPTSSRKKIDVLLQIPNGALPVGNGFFTRSIHQQLDPFSTQTVEYFFYFPMTGDFSHYPVQVADQEKVIATTPAFRFKVVEVPTVIDTTSWNYVSQHASDDEVISYLEQNNIDRLDLSSIAFRMQHKAMFERVMKLLRGRHVFNKVLWSYGIFHNVPDVIREYLRFTEFAGQCGLFLISPLLDLDPVARHLYQHKEYQPLVNARVYQLGKVRKILNAQFSAQYDALLAFLRYRAQLTDEDRMAVVYYLLLQDRVAEAAEFFAEIRAAQIVGSIQYDYFKAFFAFSTGDPEAAAVIAGRYSDYPVIRWRNLFRDVLAQTAELLGQGPALVDKDDRDQQQAVLAASAPALELKVENRTIRIDYQNLATCRLSFYAMDLELLFSRNPFVKEVSQQFAIVHPNLVKDVQLEQQGTFVEIPLPREFSDRNVMVEVKGGGITRNQAYFPHNLGIQMLETYGQVSVTHATTGKPLPKVYIKVFARMKNGQVEFFKDGYTDLRGRFDYASLSTNQLEQAERLAILILSEENGALVREAAPPKL